MNNEDVNLKSIYDKALKASGFFITATFFDKTKQEGNLEHQVVQREFPVDDIVPSLDKCVRMISPEVVKSVDVIVPPSVSAVDGRPLKIAILSHFNRMPDSFSPARATRNQIKMLKEHGHDVTLFAIEGANLDVGCEVEGVLPKFKMEKRVINEEMKEKMISVLKEHLPNYDVVITQDFFIDSLITYREAVRNCGVDKPFLHFCRSGVGSPIEFDMPNARYVYLNKADVGRFANKIGVSPDKCRTVYNEKEPAYMLSWHPITKMIVDRFHLWDRDIIQTYPMCSTRMDAKGLDSVIRTFAELKKMGKKVALIVANSNGRKRAQELINKQGWAGSMGLSEDELIFTSLLTSEEFKTESEVPNKVCAELMQLSNLFLFPSIAEVGPNVLLEACISKNLIVANSDLPLTYDFVNKEHVISYPFTSLSNLNYTSRDGSSFNKLAKQIIEKIDSNWADKTFRQVWGNHNAYNIYWKMLAPLLYETIKEV